VIDLVDRHARSFRVDDNAITISGSRASLGPSPFLGWLARRRKQKTLRLPFASTEQVLVCGLERPLSRQLLHGPEQRASKVDAHLAAIHLASHNAHHRRSRSVRLSGSSSRSAVHLSRAPCCSHLSPFGSWGPHVPQHFDRLSPIAMLRVHEHLGDPSQKLAMPCGSRSLPRSLALGIPILKGRGLLSDLTRCFARVHSTSPSLTRCFVSWSRLEAPRDRLLSSHEIFGLGAVRTLRSPLLAFTKSARACLVRRCTHVALRATHKRDPLLEARLLVGSRLLSKRRALLRDRAALSSLTIFLRALTISFSSRPRCSRRARSLSRPRNRGEQLLSDERPACSSKRCSSSNLCEICVGSLSTPAAHPHYEIFTNPFRDPRRPLPRPSRDPFETPKKSREIRTQIRS